MALPVVNDSLDRSYLHMAYNIAQLNIARFRKPIDHPDNEEFISSLDRVNAIAESQNGFIWRLTGAGNSALDIKGFEDPHIASNVSVWSDVDSLADFVYHNEEHKKIMLRRRTWFDKLDFYVVLWWVKAGHIPTLQEAIEHLDSLRLNGPTEKAFSFVKRFPAPTEM